MVEVDSLCFTNSILGIDIWVLFFDGSRSQEGSRVGCIPIDPHEKHKNIISFHLEFECTNNIFEYGAFVQGLKKGY